MISKLLRALVTRRARKVTGIDDWMDIHLSLNSPYGDIQGTIAYGIRIPIKPGNSQLSLYRCPLGFKGEIKGESPAYWFVSGENHEIKLLITKAKPTESEIRVRLYSSGKSFYGTISKDNLKE